MAFGEDQQPASPQALHVQTRASALAIMTTISRYIILAVAVTFLSSILSASAKDFENSTDVQQVRKVVPKKFGKIVNISVSHDWALCTTYSDENALSVVLHRVGSDWKVPESDGGAYASASLKALGVPSADIPSLLKVYQ
jgi:hypothetical protein